MEAYYDSDDDVCWGPITPREAIRHLKTGTATKIDRRHTFPGALENFSGNMESRSEARQGESIDLEKQIHVELVSEEDVGTLSELSFTSQTNESERGIFSEKATENLEEGFSSLDSANSEEDDINRIIMNLSDGFENVEKDSCNGNLFHRNLQSTNSENEVSNKIIVNLSDSSQKVDNDFSYDESCINLYSSDSENEGVNRRVFNSSDGLDNKENNLDLNHSYHTNLSHMNSKTDLYEKVHVEVEKMSLAEDCNSDICIESDHSSASFHQTSLKLDDTLEEIEMALKYGLDYKMPNETETDSFSNHSSKKAKDSSNCPLLFVQQETALKTGDAFGDHILKSSDRKYLNHGGSKIHKEKILKSPSLPTEAKNVLKRSHSFKSHIPEPRKERKNINCNEIKFERKEIAENAAVTIHLKPPSSIFKKPCKPLKITPKKSPNRLMDFKNVISPVGLYIKNSPAPILKQNIPAKTYTNIMTGKSSEVRVLKRIENTEIPEVIYKPAKNQILHTKTNTALPNSIKELVQEPTITKHEKRFNKKMCSNLVSRKLLQEELTYTSIDESVLDVTGDTSILSKKQGFIK